MMELARWKEPIKFEVSPVLVPEDVALDNLLPEKAWTDHRVELRAWGVTNPDHSFIEEIHYWAVVHLVDDKVTDEKRFETRDEAIDWFRAVNS